jgi:hypothetical protein
MRRRPNKNHQKNHNNFLNSKIKNVTNHPIKRVQLYSKISASRIKEYLSSSIQKRSNFMIANLLKNDLPQNISGRKEIISSFRTSYTSNEVPL